MRRSICPICMRELSYQRPRYAELPPRDVVGYSYSKVKKLIGRIFFHKDGTICDQSICKIEDLPTRESVCLSSMGGKNDPRILRQLDKPE